MWRTMSWRRMLRHVELFFVIICGLEILLLAFVMLEFRVHLAFVSYQLERGTDYLVFAIV